MLASWANTIVVCAFGLGLGATMTLAGLLIPNAFEKTMQGRREDEGIFRGGAIKREELRYLMRDPEARAWRISTASQLGLFAVLVGTIWLSPVELGWWKLLGCMVISSALVQGTFRRARAGRLHTAQRRPFGLFAEAELPEPTNVRKEQGMWTS